MAHPRRKRPKSRHRFDRPPITDGATADGYDTWLTRRYPSNTALSVFEKIDLTKFVRDTSNFASSPADRLRQFAEHVLSIAGESEAQPQGWLVLARIYERAIALAEKAELADVWRSRAIAAHDCSYGIEDSADDPSRVAERLRNEAYRSIHRAIELDKNSARAYLTLGTIAYADPGGDTHDALGALESALALEPTQDKAKFLRACALQDLERWKDAVRAYDEIGANYFAGSNAWRREVFLENRAMCLLRSGNLAGAEAAFTAIVQRYEKDLHLALDAPLVSLVEVATGPFYATLGGRVRRLLVHVEDRNLLKVFDELALRTRGQ